MSFCNPDICQPMSRIKRVDAAQARGGGGPAN